MIVETVVDYEAISNVGSSAIYNAVMAKISHGARFKLGLATGNTMIRLYELLAGKLNRAKAS